MREFVLGMKAKADELGAAVVGEPLEDEHYFPDGTTSLQVTTRGVMIYSKAGNVVHFLPGALPKA